MRIAIERRPRPDRAAGSSELVEVVTPRTNTAVMTPVENLLAAVSRPAPFSLEIAATTEARWFLARATSPAMRRHLVDLLGVAYPQAELRLLDLTRYPGLDPARLGAGEQVASRVFALRGPPYLPLRLFRESDVDAGRATQADPILGILGAMGNLPPGWRALSQLILRPAPDDWCRGYLRLAVEDPLAAERVAARADTSLTSVVVLAGLLVAGVLAFQGDQWLQAGDWRDLGLLIGSLGAGVPGLIWVLRRLGNRPVYDRRFIQEKVSRIAYRSQLRLSLFAPGEVPSEEVAARLDQIAAAYRQFNLAAGNGLVPVRVDSRGRDSRLLAPFPPKRATVVLNTRELAGLWHLPQAAADLPFVERTTARRRLPLPVTVARGCRIGTSNHQERAVPIALPDELLRRNLLLVAKTRRGKSSLMLQIARYLTQTRSGDRIAPAVVVVDPHRDLARAILGVIPPDRRDAVVSLDLSARERPYGLNLLDVGLGWDRDKAVANALSIFKHEFSGFWGPRMEDAFRFALNTLFEANQAVCVTDPHGRSRQYTVLQVPTILSDPVFAQSLLGVVRDPLTVRWWSGYFASLDRRQRIDIINPVQTKVQKFAGSYAARAVVGQASSTIDPHRWLRDGQIVVVNTAKGEVGEDTAALVGGTLINLVALVVAEQVRLPPAQRRPVTLLVDEFHTIPGADYEAILSELAKYGANLILATQSLARLDALDRAHTRALRGTLFANLDGLFAFQTSAEDARYLVRELGDTVDEADLIALDDHHCYARLSVGGERLPTFSLALDPPPPSDPAVADKLARASAIRDGRDRATVERDLQETLDRIDFLHQARSGTTPGEPDVGVGEVTAPPEGATAGGSRPSRSQGRPRSKQEQHRKDAAQPTLFDEVPEASSPSDGGAAAGGDLPGDQSAGPIA